MDLGSVVGRHLYKWERYEQVSYSVIVKWGLWTNITSIFWGFSKSTDLWVTLQTLWKVSLALCCITTAPFPRNWSMNKPKNSLYSAVATPTSNGRLAKHVPGRESWCYAQPRRSWVSHYKIAKSKPSKPWKATQGFAWGLLGLVTKEITELTFPSSFSNIPSTSRSPAPHTEQL